MTATATKEWRCHVLKKFASFEVMSAVLVPKNAGPSRLARIRRQAHRHHFDYEPRRGFLYVRSRAISSRTNDNYDEFPAEEIKQAYRTFIGKPVFVNHVNDNHKRARGVIIDAALHEDRLADGQPDTWAEVLMEIDAVRFPKLANAILKGRIDRTSMGCDVAYSICSMCGNKASTPAEYCSHIPRLKGKKVLKRNAATGSQETHLIRETCYGLKFFENSVLVEEPADPTAHFLGVDDHSGLGKAASRQDDLDYQMALSDLEDVLREDNPSLPRGSVMDAADQHVPDHAPGTFERHVDDQVHEATQKIAQWYYQRSQVSGDPIVHPAGHPVQDGRRGLDVGDHVLFDSGHSARIHAVTPTLLLLEGHSGPMHRGPIEGDHSKSVWSSDTVDEAGQDVPEMSDEQRRFLDSNTKGPTKFSLLQHFAEYNDDPKHHPQNHLHLGEPGEPCANCQWGIEEHPHPSTGDGTKCTTCGKDYKRHYLHDQGRYEHLQEVGQRDPRIDGSTTHLFEQMGKPYGGPETDENGWHTEKHPGMAKSESECHNDGHGPWNLHGQCKSCGYTAETEGDEECDEPYCQENGFPEGWHTKAEHIDPPHLDPGHPDYQSAERSIRDAFGDDSEMWSHMLRQQDQGPTKFSSLTGFFASHPTGPYYQGDESDEAISHAVAWDRENGVDAWGRPLHQPYDGHGAWDCNNYECVEHPQSMYEQGVGMPGWMQHDLDPDKDAKREVNKAFHETGEHDEARWLMDQQHEGPSKYSKKKHRKHTRHHHHHNTPESHPRFHVQRRTWLGGWGYGYYGGHPGYCCDSAACAEASSGGGDIGGDMGGGMGAEAMLTRHFADNSHRLTGGDPGEVRPARTQTHRQHLIDDHGYSEQDLKGLMDRHWQRARDGEVGVPKGTDHLHGVVDFLEAPFKAEHDHLHSGGEYEADGHRHPNLDRLAEPRIEGRPRSTAADPMRGGSVDPFNPNVSDYKRLRGTHPDLPNLQKGHDPKDPDTWTNLSGCQQTYPISDDERGDYIKAANDAHRAVEQGKISREQFEGLGHLCPDCGAFKYLHAQPYEFDTDRLSQTAPITPLRQSLNSGDADRWVTCGDGHMHWGAAGAAGMLIRHTDEDGTRRYLLQHRAPWVDQGGTYSVPGGAMRHGEAPHHAAQREAEDELGPLPALSHVHTHTDDHGGWAYHTVIADADHQFEPYQHDHETGSGGARWVTAEEMRDLPLHSGFAQTWPKVRHHAARPTPLARQATWIGDHPDEPTLFWRAPKTKRWEVHIENHMPDRDLRERYGAEPSQNVILYHADHIAPPHPNAPAGSAPRGGWRVERNSNSGEMRFPPTAWGNVIGHVPPHVMQQVHNAFAEVDRHAQNHAELFGQVAHQQDEKADAAKQDADIHWRNKMNRQFDGPGANPQEPPKPVSDADLYSWLYRQQKGDHTGAAKTASESDDLAPATGTCERCGKPNNHIHLEQSAIGEIEGAAQAGQMYGEMHDHAQKRPVNLADHHDLHAHILEAHGYSGDDLWRNSHDEDHPALGPFGDEDRPLTKYEIRRLHDWEHGHGIANEHPDYNGGEPGHFIGDSHFHTASRTAAAGLTRHQIPAEEVVEGDFLDIGGKVRVHKTMTRGDNVSLAWRLRGSKAPGVRVHQVGETVSVWRKGEDHTSSLRKSAEFYTEDEMRELGRQVLAEQAQSKPENQRQRLDGVSLGRDDDGYYVYTHRARSNSYESPEAIPDSKVEFIRSTGAKKDDFEGPSVSGVVLKAADTGRILMLQRSMADEKDPAAGTWEFPGGHHEDGDKTSLHAAIREWEEEVGQEFPEGGHVAHTWRSPNGIYMGHVVVIPEEKSIALHEGRVLVNPDDPDGDDSEQAAWWDPKHAEKNPALRTEVKKAPWEHIRKAAGLRRQASEGDGRLPGGYLSQHADGQEYWAKPTGEAPYNPIMAAHGIEPKQEGHGPWHIIRHPETRAYHLIDNQGRSVGSGYKDPGNPKYELNDRNAERQVEDDWVKANQEHGHMPPWEDRDGNKADFTGMGNVGQRGGGYRLRGTGHATGTWEPSGHVDQQHVIFHAPPPPIEHTTEDPRIAEYRRRAEENPAPKVHPPKAVQQSSSREHGTTYRQVQHGDPDYDAPGSFHDPSPEDEWHGPYRVIQHPETGKYHVVDNQNRVTGYGGRNGMDEQHNAEFMRDYADGRQSSKEQAKGIAEKIFGGAMEALDPGGTSESRRAEQNMHNMNRLQERYQGGDHHPLNPGRFGYDKDDEGDNGQPYYEVEDPQGSGWTARDYGGTQVKIHHRATGDTEHDLYSFDSSSNEKHPDFGHDELHQVVHNFAHGDPSESEEDRWAPGPDYAEAEPKIKRWQQRNGYGR
jgi:8-oxo-dGTP pyrophosphatase MutT (NUDIX family)